MSPFFVAAGVDTNGMPCLALATHDTNYRMNVADARALAAKLIQVADMFDQIFKTELVVEMRPAWKPAVTP